MEPRRAHGTDCRTASRDSPHPVAHCRVRAGVTGAPSFATPRGYPEPECRVSVVRVTVAPVEGNGEDLVLAVAVFRAHGTQAVGREQLQEFAHTLVAPRA